MRTWIIRTLVMVVGGLLLAPTSALGKPAAKTPPPPQMPQPKAKKPKPSRAVAPASATASPEEAAPSRRKQYMSFEDEDVEATREGGAGTVVGGERRGKHSSLIQVREDFIDRLVKSAEDI
jgi:type IV secretory pathway VirB10-like protein